MIFTPIPMPKRAIGIAFGLPDLGKDTRLVNALIRAAGVELKETSRQAFYVRLDTLRPDLKTRLTEHLKKEGVSVPPTDTKSH